MVEFTLRPISSEDRAWVSRFTAEQWGSDQIVVHGSIFRASELPGVIATQSAETVGLVTYHILGDQCEIISLNSLHEAIGIGSALIKAIQQIAQAAGCKRLFLVTTNDNLHALRFYQRHGFTLAALRANAVSEARKIKPEIPLIGDNAIPIRDEIELEMQLNEAQST